MRNLPSPKVPRSLIGRASWFPYYAGYSAEFVRSAISKAGLEPGAVVFDPWNGAGTTTEVAASLGFRAIGRDISPSAVEVAVARMASAVDIDVALLRAASLVADCTELPINARGADALENWFDAASAAGIRSLYQAFSSDPELSRTQKALLSLALFKSVRAEMGQYRASNPTWVKKAGAVKTNLQGKELAASFLASIGSLREQRTQPETFCCSWDIALGDSRQLDLKDCSVDLVVTSPPYCTRIDYAVALSVENAILTNPSKAITRDLRNETMGTSTIRISQPVPAESWGPTCIKLAENIRTHDSYASEAYYYKTYVQYFSDLYDSLSELARVLKPSATAYVVVQNSFYKDLKVDLAKIVTEMLEKKGFALRSQRRFMVSRSLADVHKHSKKYRLNANLAETVLWIEKST